MLFLKLVVAPFQVWSKQAVMQVSQTTQVSRKADFGKRPRSNFISDGLKLFFADGHDCMAKLVK